MREPCSPTDDPRILHWHLRKTGGTDVRNTMHGYACYTEVHATFGRYMTAERHARKEPNASCGGGGVRRLAVLRHPWTQLLSEQLHFPESFLHRNGSVKPLPENHLICSHQAGMGLCPRNRCNASAVLEALQIFDHIGFVERLDAVYDTLRSWLRCSADRASLQQLTRAKLRFRPARPMQSNATVRLWQNEGLKRDNATRVKARLLLSAFPSWDEFQRSQRCSLEVYERLSNRLGAVGGPPPG